MDWSRPPDGHVSILSAVAGKPLEAVFAELTLAENVPAGVLANDKGRAT
jgi:hypothetical protein